MTILEFPNVPIPGTGSGAGVNTRPKPAPSLPNYHPTHRVVPVRAHTKTIATRSPAYVAKHTQLSDELFWRQFEAEFCAIVDAECAKAGA